MLRFQVNDSAGTTWACEAVSLPRVGEYIVVLPGSASAAHVVNVTWAWTDFATPKGPRATLIPVVYVEFETS